MDRIKKILRLIVLTLLIILALSGIGIGMGYLLPRNRQDYNGKETTIEMVDKKEDSENEKT